MEFPIQFVGEIFELAQPALFSAPPTFVRFDRFLASKPPFPPQARKAIGFEDFLALEFLFARYSKDNHQLTWHFAPPTFSEKLQPQYVPYNKKMFRYFLPRTDTFGKSMLRGKLGEK